MDTKRITKLHEEAMSEAEAGHLLRLAVNKHFRVAFDKEAEAATLAADGPEPTRSILRRSATALAKDCGSYVKAREFLEMLGD